MRIAVLLLIVLLTINILSTVLSKDTPSSYAQTIGRAKYMYKVVRATYDEQAIQTVVDLFARDGWELVTHYNDIVIFKK